MSKKVWRPEDETTERLIDIRDGRATDLRSHHARIIADKEIERRKSAA